MTASNILCLGTIREALLLSVVARVDQSGDNKGLV